MADPVTAYAESVLSGQTVAGRLVRLACRRHLDDVAQGPRRGLKWDLDRVQRAIQFFGFLRLAEGAFHGQGFQLHPFQKFIVGSLFGWLGADGFRRFRTAYCEMGKGNGKTPLAAGIGLYGLVGDDEHAAEIYSAATTREQASILFRDAKLLAESSPALRSRLDIGQANIAFLARASFFRAVSSEHRGLDGKRPHMALIDELHEHPTSMVVDKMRAGTKSRRQALIFEITNSGYDRHSVCWQHRDYSVKVLEGVLQDDSWFAYVCGLDPCEACRKEGRHAPDDGCQRCDRWTDEAVWPKANPGLDTILPRKYLREQVREAQGMPGKQSIVKRLNFCIWTEQSRGWLSLEDWDRGGEPLDLEALRGQPCYAGLDLGRVKDLSALALLFPPGALPRWSLLLFFWLPEEDVRPRVERDRVPYDVWVRDGWIQTTPGNTTDFSWIGAKILELGEVYDIKEVAYDRTFAGELVNTLMAEGVNMVAFGQGFLSMGAPTAELERLVKAGEIQHGGNPVLRWMVSNCAVRQDPAGNLKPDKEASTERIDGVVATIMALGRAIVREQILFEPTITWI